MKTAFSFPEKQQYEKSCSSQGNPAQAAIFAMERDLQSTRNNWIFSALAKAEIVTGYEFAAGLCPRYLKILRLLF